MHSLLNQVNGLMEIVMDMEIILLELILMLVLLFGGIQPNLEDWAVLISTVMVMQMLMICSLMRSHNGMILMVMDLVIISLVLNQICALL